MEKYGTGGRATEDIKRCRCVACWLANIYKDTLTLCNTHCFSTTTMVTRTCRNVTFVRTLSVVVYIIYTTEFLLGRPDSRDSISPYTRVGTLIVATIYLQVIQNRYMFRSFTVLQCSHQHCIQLVANYVEVIVYL